MQYVTPSKPAYPSLLRHIHTPPSLYVEGDISVCEGLAISIIGSRKPSDYGMRVVEKLVRDLARAGCVFVSGLAFGVDAAVHRVALACGARCVGVLAGGLDEIYPAVHTGLAEEVVQSGGCLLTEYSPGVRPRRYQFLERNRIIAALSPVTVVIEAGVPSGTYSTALHAMREGRAVAVVLGDVDRESSEGCYRLYREGAQVVASAEDILALASYERAIPASLPLQPALTGSAAIVYRALSGAPDSADRLSQLTALPIQSLMSVLSVLELDGYIRREGTTWHTT